MTDIYVEERVGGAYFMPMEERVARLEEDMHGVKTLLSRLEPMIIRIDATLTSTLPHLATKAELIKVHTEIAEVRSELRSEIREVRADVRGELADLRTDLRGEIADIRTDLRGEIADVRGEIGGLRTDLRGEFGDLRVEMHDRLADLPTKTYLWGILGVLTAAYGSGLAALAVLK